MEIEVTIEYAFKGVEILIKQFTAEHLFFTNLRDLNEYC